MSRMPRAFRGAEGAAMSSLLLQEMRDRSDSSRAHGPTDQLSRVPPRSASGEQQPRKVESVCVCGLPVYQVRLDWLPLPCIALHCHSSIPISLLIRPNH